MNKEKLPSIAWGEDTLSKYLTINFNIQLFGSPQYYNDTGTTSVSAKASMVSEYKEWIFNCDQNESDSGHSKKDKFGSFTVPSGVYRLGVALCDGGRSSSSNGVRNDWHSSYFGNLDSTKNATNRCRGCDASMTFKDYNRASDGGRFGYNGYYGAPYRYRDGMANYFSGYIDVTPGQVFNYRVGRAGNKACCGFVFVCTAT